jgi:TolA-binding protein
MDCAKLDEMAIDLVYDELDARALADAEQHLLGCTRCRTLVDRLRAGKKGAESLALESPSSLLESRIVEAATKAARTRAPLPWPRRFARAISTAGAYAMRPQVAMAAVVVVMVGMSVVLLRGGVTNPHRTKVTEEGTPVASVEKNVDDDQGALGNLEQQEPKQDKAPIGGAAGAGAVAQNAPTATAAPLDEAAKEEGKDDELDHDGVAALEKEKKLADKTATIAGESAGDGADLPPQDGKAKGKAAAGPGAPPPPAATTTPAPVTGGKSNDPTSPTFDAAMDAYVKANYADAAKGFDAAAAAGTRPSMSTLYAARSLRAMGSCAQAMPRFKKVLSTWPASAEVPWAALEGGECARTLGDDATAKTLFVQAQGYPATKARADTNLASMQGPPAGASKPPSSYASPKKSAPIMNDSY